MKRLFLTLILGGAVLFSCTKKENIGPDDNGDNNLVPISLSSKVELLSRGTLQESQIEANEDVSFFVTKTGDTETVAYGNAKLIANGDGSFTYPEGVMYYPTAYSNVDFYAVHPYNVLWDLNEINFSVKEDQSNVKDFLNSDLLYAKTVDIAKSKNAVAMTFKHKLSKLNFTIKQGDGIELSKLSGVEVMNIQKETSMNVVDGALTAVNGTATNIKAYGVKGTTETTASGMSAIVAPQTASAGNKLFKITIDGTDFFYTPSQAVNFESGKKYNYTLTIKNGGIEVTSTIEDWLPGGDFTGEGTID